MDVQKPLVAVLLPQDAVVHVLVLVIQNVIEYVQIHVERIALVSARDVLQHVDPVAKIHVVVIVKVALHLLTEVMVAIVVHVIPRVHQLALIVAVAAMAIHARHVALAVLVTVQIVQITRLRHHALRQIVPRHAVLRVLAIVIQRAIQLVRVPVRINVQMHVMVALDVLRNVQHHVLENVLCNV